MLKELSIEDFLKELASEKPAPGGGSVAAISGALAASLVSMVARLTKAPGMKSYVKRSEKLRMKLSAMIDKDTAAFNAVMAAYRLPRVTKQEAEKRQKKIQAALKNAAATPLQTARLCYEALTLAETLAPVANPRALSDMGVAALLADAGIRSALMNVKINLASIKDRKFEAKTKKVINDMADHKDRAAKTIKFVHGQIENSKK